MARELGTARRLVVFALGLAVVLGGGALVGSAVGPEPDEGPPAPVEHVEEGPHG